MGYGEDPRVKKALNWLVRIQNSDGGWLCPYWKAHIKYKHSCFYGTICSLEAFSEVPETKRSSEINSVIEKAVEFLLTYASLVQGKSSRFKSDQSAMVEVQFSMVLQLRRFKRTLSCH
jgi:hypothetical protein